MHPLAKAYQEEIVYWRRLSEDQRALLIAFIYCLQLRLDGVDFRDHWAAMCGREVEPQLGRDYYE